MTDTPSNHPPVPGLENGSGAPGTLPSAAKMASAAPVSPSAQSVSTTSSTARQDGDQETRFSGHARVQVVCEFAYLGFATLASIFLLFWVITRIAGAAGPDETASWFEASLRLPPVAIVAALFFSGMIGGCAFSMKWLYHSVAKNTWFKDRLWWRLSVPWMGGLLGVFASFIFARTLGTNFDATALAPQNLFPALGLSFLVGVFADGVLASLEKLARKIFGTLNELGGP